MRLIDADALAAIMAFGKINGVKDLFGFIDQAPTVRPAAGEWKPLSEGLPEKNANKKYLFLRDGYIHIGCWFVSYWSVLGLGKYNDEQLAVEFSHYAEINKEAKNEI